MKFIYTNESYKLNQTIELPLNSISKIEIYNKDKNATTKSWVFGSLGVGLGVYIIFAILISIIVFFVALGSL